MSSPTPTLDVNAVNALLQGAIPDSQPEGLPAGVVATPDRLAAQAIVTYALPQP